MMTFPMTPLLLISTLITCYVCFAAGQTPCALPSGTSGRCMALLECDSVMKDISSATPASPVILTQSFCGFDAAGQTVKVCCPPVTCTTPDGAHGACLSLQSCPRLLKFLQSRPMLTAIKHALNHKCKGEKFSVCCAMDTPKPDEEYETTEVCQLTSIPPKPVNGCCGYSTGDPNKIIGGTKLSLDEHPWLGLIEYVKDYELRLKCGATLISGQYVLTAAHCVSGAALKDGVPSYVRLGDYNIETSGPDCEVSAGGGEDCNDGAVSILINQTIVHPDYDPSSYKNDIALIRLNSIANFTDFIRPICLPTVDFTTHLSENVNLYAAGWGTTENNNWSDVKLQVTLPYVTNQECRGVYGRRQILSGQMCAGGQVGRDTCSGDSGGPLMRLVKDQYELVGITSFGHMCGNATAPTVYTKVFDYLPWIIKEITGFPSSDSNHQTKIKSNYDVEFW